MANDRVQQRFDEARERFVTAANAAGIDPEIMVKIAGFESSGYNPDARPVSRDPERNTVRQFDGVMAISSAHGYGQFLNGTWKDMINKYGEKYGVDGAATMTRAQANAPELRTNRDLQAAMLAEFTRDNLNAIRGIAGPNPDANVYAMHNLGGRDGPRFLRALRDNPDALVSANGLLSADVIQGNPSLYKDGQLTLTVREAYGRMAEQLAPYQRYADQVAGRTQAETPSPQTAGRTPERPAADPLADGRLQAGERGEAVRKLQQDLQTLGVQFRDGQGRNLPATGFYGEQTTAAVREFQGTHNLPRTGVADEATRTAIDTAARERASGQSRPETPNRPDPAPQTRTGPQSFDDVMRTMLPPRNGVAPHITSDYGPRILNGKPDDHGGVDFNYVGGQRGPNLQHPQVRSPVSGVVVFGEGQGNSGMVKIRDDHGNLHEILHLDSRSVRVTNPPTRVEAGDVIGAMGGRGPTGPGNFAQHVHYQMKDSNGRLIDPEAYWNNPQHRQSTDSPTRTETPARTDTPQRTDTPARSEIPARNEPAPSRNAAMADNVLRRGEAAPEVGHYQRILADLGYRGADGKPLKVDEKFGPNTEFATRQFQRDHGIEQLGVIGPKTRAAAEQAGRELVTHPDNPNNRLFKQTLDKVHAAEDGRGVAHGEHSRNLAAALTVEAIRERVTQVDRVEFSRDGSMARAVQFGSNGDRPELNRGTDGIATQQAATQPIRESSEQAEQVANNVRVQQAQQPAQQQPAAVR